MRTSFISVLNALLCVLFMLALVGGKGFLKKKTTLEAQHVGGQDVSLTTTISQPTRLLQEVDDETLKRYLAAPTGYRRHPSYYSNKYLTRAQPVTDQKELDKWGKWTLVDTKRSSRPGDDFYQQYSHRDVPWDDFPALTAWQKDSDYLPKFLEEGIALVERAMEAILTEYGYGKDRDDRPFEERIQLLNTVNSLQKGSDSYKGLVRRILHSIVTEDTFTFAMAGHSAAAGHGNHFQQSYTHAYGKIMEPIFARLGVLSTSRNFGFGGLGTLQTGMATSALVGPDVDLLMWDSGMTEKGGPPLGILGLQAALSGDRIPYYLIPGHGFQQISDLNTGAAMDTGMLSDVGKFTPGAKLPEDIAALPWASQCLKVNSETKSICPRTYRGTCWVDRSNFEWAGMDMSYTPDSGCNGAIGHPGGRASWHPGDKVHQQTGRALAGFVLHGLRDALILWKDSENLVLKDEDWHVAEYYENIRTQASTSFAETGKSWCKRANVPERVCQARMHAATEFTPRYDAARNSIRHLMKVYGAPMKAIPSQYDPPDMLNPFLHPPEGSLDVLQILENGIDFAPNFGRIRRRDNLVPADYEPPQIGSSVNHEIVPGKGWSIQRIVSGSDMCDGEYDSWCHRGRGSSCLMSGHNDNRGDISFDSLSGWGIFELRDMREGLIMIKHHDWMPVNANKETAGWSTVNNVPESTNGRFLDEDFDDRNLKSSQEKLCDDFQFEFALDGKVTKWGKEEWTTNMKKPQRVVQFNTLLDDPEFTGGKTKNVELAMRVTGCGRLKTVALTHIYWA